MARFIVTQTPRKPSAQSPPPKKRKAGKIKGVRSKALLFLSIKGIYLNGNVPIIVLARTVAKFHTPIPGKDHLQSVCKKYLDVCASGGLFDPTYEKKNTKTKVPNKIKTHVPYKFYPKSSKVVNFYSSRAWRNLRYKALKKYGAICHCCNVSRKQGKVMHVDHIKPRSKYPLLELRLDNLQILCEDCNLGKSNTDETDWR